MDQKINVSYYDEDSLLTISPKHTNTQLRGYIDSEKDQIQQVLLNKGAILFRGFEVGGPESFSTIARQLSPNLLEYNERSTPRSEVKDQVYTSTEYPSEFSIPMHNENSYAASWPMKVWFCCQIKASYGGETPIADSRRVYEKMSPKIKHKFIDKNVMYVRNYDGKLDLSWETAFQTNDKNQVERYCKANKIDIEWISPTHLRTRTVRQSIAVHPFTKDTVWFNQAHLFHVSSLPDEVRNWLFDSIGEEGLPRNTYFGDGSVIEDEIIQEIMETYKEVTHIFKWEERDVLLLDNMIMAHGRSPYQGDRKILVAMAEACSIEGVH